MMRIEELGKRLEPYFDEADEIEQRELNQIRMRDESTQTKISIENELSKHCLENTRKNFDEILRVLKISYVGEPATLPDRAFKDVLPLALEIYKDGLLSVHLEREIEYMKRPELKELPPELVNLAEVSSVKTLKQKIKAHFIIGELMYALGVRVDKSGERTPKAEYAKVVQEGEALDDKLEKFEHDEIYYLTRIRLCHDVGIAYKRLYDIAYDSNHIKEAKTWLWKMFDINTYAKGKFDLVQVMLTGHEFKRYIKEVKELSLGCVFMRHNKEDAFECVKTSNLCSYKKGAVCGLYDPKDSKDSFGLKEVKVRAETHKLMEELDS